MIAARVLIFSNIWQAKQVQQTLDSPEEQGRMEPNSDTCHFAFGIATPSPAMSQFNE